jgi:protease I
VQRIQTIPVYLKIRPLHPVHDKEMDKAIILVENGFEDVELLYPYYRLQEAGYEVEVVGPKAGETYSGKKGGSIKSTKEPEDIDVKDFKALIIPGGWAPDRMRTRDGMVKLVKEADSNGLVIGAICHAAQMLIEAEVVEGRRLTCVRSVSTDVKNAGGVYVNEPVVIDGNLVTSRFPPDMPVWLPTILRQLE